MTEILETFAQAVLFLGGAYLLAGILGAILAPWVWRQHDRRDR